MRSRQLLSVLIPTRNEAGVLASTIASLVSALDSEKIPFEMIVIDDHSIDGTADEARRAAERDPRVRLAANSYESGFGMAVRRGLELFTGDFCAIFMADASDCPRDLVTYYRMMLEGYDCVFGTRFSDTYRPVDYPAFKLIINRLANFFIRAFFLLPYNDFTNAFKCYSRRTIEGIQPLVSRNFEITVEMPVKAMLKGYRWVSVPVRWRGRMKGISKWKLKETGSAYCSITMHLWRKRNSWKKS